MANYHNDLTTLASRLRPLLLSSASAAGTATAAQHEFICENPGTFTINTGGLRAYNRFGSSFTIAEVHCSVSAAVAGTAVIVDVNKGGTTIFTDQANRPSIAVGDYTATAGTIDVTTFANGDYFTIDVDQGSGSNLAVCILVQ